MFRYFYIFIGLAFLFIHFQAIGQKQLIFKLKPDYANEFKEGKGEFQQFISQLNFSPAERKYPLHKTPIAKKNKLGRALIDLSLMYVLDVPFPMASNFTLEQFRRRKELEYAEWEVQEAFPLSRPNDPNADSLTGSQRYVLQKIKAYQAWSISQGDTNVVIGILDTGIPVEHEDLKTQIKINPSDPPNGIDDDQNGLVDDYRGWDFGSNDNDPTPDDLGIKPGHGTSVAGLAAAATNNAKGVAGVAYKCKIWPIKIWKWAGGFSNFKGYEAIVYAADKGCKVINCSWGSARINNQYEQDIINYATFNKNALIVAAGGNTAGFYNILPANYDNVLGVTMTDTTDQIFWAATQNFKMDIAAPGVNIFGILTNGGYGWVDGGTSMSAPLVAGAAALVRSKYPELTGLQAGELLRVNTDTIYSVPGNPNYRDRSGRGRLNVLKALQKQQNISLRPVEIQLNTKNGITSNAGDTVQIYVRFENYLEAISGFEATAFSSDTNLTIFQNAKTFGPMPSSASLSQVQPFLAVVRPNLQTPIGVLIRIDVKVGNLYSDRRVFIVYLNQGVLDLNANKVQLSIASNGRLGFLDENNAIGSGIKYKGAQFCGEAGLMIGTGPGKISNCVFNSTFAIDNHFKVENQAKFTPYKNMSQHAVHHMNDSLAGPATIGLGIKQSSYELSVDSLSNTVFLNYQITNRNTYSIDSLCVAQYNDWEVENYNENFGSWNSNLKLGYTKGKSPKNRIAGVQILSQGEPQFYAIDALNNSANENINLFDGFSLAEKWKTMSSGTARSSAGQGSSGNNIVQVTGVKLRNLAAGETRKVTFAYLLADSLEDLTKRAKANQNFWNQLNISPSPSPINAKFCNGDSVMFEINKPNQISKFQVFKTDSDPNPVYSGQIFKGIIKTDSSLYLIGIDSVFAGPRVVWNWSKVQKPSATFATLGTSSQDSVFLDSSLNFKALDTSVVLKNRWIVNGKVLSDTGFQIQVQFDTVKIYQICLQQTEPIGNCQTQTCTARQVVFPVSRFGDFENIDFRISPNPVHREMYFSSNEFNLNFRLLDLCGKELMQQHLKEKQGRVEIPNLPKGIYGYQLKGKNGNSFGRIMVE